MLVPEGCRMGERVTGLGVGQPGRGGMEQEHSDRSKHLCVRQEHAVACRESQ